MNTTYPLVNIIHFLECWLALVCWFRVTTSDLKCITETFRTCFVGLMSYFRTNHEDNNQKALNYVDGIG